MLTVWVLECVWMLCDPTAALRRTWETKAQCRVDVIDTINKMEPRNRFTWRCVEIMPRQPAPIPTAEDLERP